MQGSYRNKSKCKVYYWINVMDSLNEFCSALLQTTVIQPTNVLGPVFLRNLNALSEASLVRAWRCSEVSLRSSNIFAQMRNLGTWGGRCLYQGQEVQGAGLDMTLPRDHRLQVLWNGGSRECRGHTQFCPLRTRG